MTGIEAVAATELVSETASVAELATAAEGAGVGTEVGTADAIAETEGLNLVELGEAVQTEVAREVPLLDSKGEVHQQISQAEMDHFDEIGLEAREVAGREARVRDDIDWNRVDDDTGETNLERAERGRAPLDSDGNAYELHHVGREDDGVLAELTQAEHRGGGNDEMLHGMEPEKAVDRAAFGSHRGAHWQARAAEVRDSTGGA